MRPDDHKAKESRRYQNKKKKEGDTTASEVAEARKRAAKARDRGVGIAAIRRRNGEVVESEEDKEQRKLLQAKFSKRKLDSNQYRYQEETEQESLEKDAELGIDRETTDLVYMLENNDEASSTFFKFKDEQIFNNTDSATISQDTSRNILQLDFKLFENTLDLYDTDTLLGLEDEKDIIFSALNEQPVVLDKPIVPGFSKNAKGYVLFKSQPIKPNVISEEDGIYLRNDGSNHRVETIKTTPTVIPSEKPPSNKDTADDLDELLALDNKPKTTTLPKRTVALPKPGTIKKPVIKKTQDINPDDEAWLDDILG